MDKVLFRSLTFFVLFVLTTPKGRLYIVKLEFPCYKSNYICRAHNISCELFLLSKGLKMKQTIIKTIEYIFNTPELFYLSTGVLSSFLMAIMRSKKNRFISKLAEGLTCSMLSSALIVISEYYLKLPFELSLPIGTFVGFLGSDYISQTLKGVISKKVKKDDNN